MPPGPRDHKGIWWGGLPSARRCRNWPNSLTARDLVQCGQKWLAYLTPFFSEKERKQAGCQHRLFFSQVEYCDNLIFRRRAALDQWGDRRLDANGASLTLGYFLTPLTGLCKEEGPFILTPGS